MNAILFIGLLIVFIVAIITGGIIWAKRQVKFVAAERAAGYRGLFTLGPLPSPGDEVQILVDDESGMRPRSRPCTGRTLDGSMQ